ncbi:3'-5' exonuclease [Alkanindiges sp. WGS2144]|uniref:3'-5' exonuclease n=1 Tax=Alkanindiges sp. WGS2144 TaxID=3366808 RepID=UPI0037505D89
MLNLPVLVFDIETIPDIKAGARLYGLDLPDEDVVLAMNAIRRQECGSDFPRLPLHEVVCISGLWVSQTSMKLFSFCKSELSEKQIISRFLNSLDQHFPCLVSWNGKGFDIPVITLRAMLYGLTAQNLFDQGEFEQSRKYNNYQNRYHHCHIDLMDCLAQFNARNFQRLDELALLLGFPGKQGQSGYHVYDYVKNQQWQELCQYCESDVLNTWLIYLRWQLLRGHLTDEAHAQWLQLTHDYLREQVPGQHDFLAQWQKNARLTPFNVPIV